jgi:hypothetical protein
VEGHNRLDMEAADKPTPGEPPSLQKYLRKLQGLVESQGPAGRVEDGLPLDLSYPVLNGNFAKEGDGRFWERMEREYRVRLAEKFRWCARAYGKELLGLEGKDLGAFVHRQLRLAFPPLAASKKGADPQSSQGVLNESGTENGPNPASEQPPPRLDGRRNNRPPSRFVPAETIEATTELLAGLAVEEGEEVDFEGHLDWVYRNFSNPGVTTHQEALKADTTGRLAFLKWARANEKAFRDRYATKKPRGEEAGAESLKKDERKLQRLIEDALKDTGGNLPAEMWFEGARVLEQNGLPQLAERNRAIGRTMGK